MREMQNLKKQICIKLANEVYLYLAGHDKNGNLIKDTWNGMLINSNNKKKSSHLDLVQKLKIRKGLPKISNAELGLLFILFYVKLILFL